ncbi:Fur family transcriptional regulator [Rummeliibacillus sp. SL167]|uniref:Fur family transcriptional regulator n=1 Tax=Rummeliibacillus sp. SL167 TaxID=2579792 RepID=UPI0011B5AA51|nr:transcriptional repressor [Rummeliibacillus sp. SL167]
MYISKIDQVEQILEASHLEITDQRVAIVKYLQNNTNHPMAKDVFDALRTKFPSLTIDIVNRELELLLEKQLIRKISIMPTLTRYDGNLQSHYHVICIRCHQATDFHYPNLIDIESIASQITKHQVYAHELILFGVCEECSRPDHY